MAVILFKKGNTTKVNGIPCQIQICNEYSYLHLLDEGWFYTPEECYSEPEPELVEVPEIKEETPEEPEETEEETTGPVPESSEDEIRAMAKAAGISHWHNKSIERLINELKELEDDE